MDSNSVLTLKENFYNRNLGSQIVKFINLKGQRLYLSLSNLFLYDKSQQIAILKPEGLKLYWSLNNLFLYAKS